VGKVRFASPRYATALFIGTHLMIERRKITRLRSLKSAQIIFHRHWPPIDCIIRNLTADGACLEMADSFSVTLAFDLIFTQGRIERPSRQVWRSKNRMGVSFG
jgi:hypothetical protein